MWFGFLGFWLIKWMGVNKPIPTPSPLPDPLTYFGAKRRTIPSNCVNSHVATEMWRTWNYYKYDIQVQGWCSNLLHKPPIFKFSSRRKNKNGDGTTHQVEDQFRILAFRMHMHTNKVVEIFLSIDARKEIRIKIF